MKKLTHISLILLIPALCFAQQERGVDTKISNVTVFLNRAQVTRTGNISVPAGKSDLVISGITSQLDPESIQVKGTGSMIILGVQHRLNFLNEFNKPAKLKVLSDSLAFVKKQIATEQNQKDILTKEEQLILSNQKIGGTQQNVTVAELKAMADFFRNRLAEIGLAKIVCDENIAKYNERFQKLNRQIAEETDTYSRNTGEIVISVSAESATRSTLEITYLVQGAGWTPVYDLRAKDTKSPIALAYKANVFQSSGEEWKDVKLTLSTADPNQGGLKPELFAWYLDVYQPIPIVLRGRAAGAVAKSEAFEDRIATAPAETTANYVSAVQTTLNTQFEISLPYTVASSGKSTLVDIQNLEMKADYHYVVAPKLDPDAFLVANATGWEDFNLLPGEANVFFEGTFVAKTFIDPNNVKDTLTVSLGRDKRIVVKREKIKDYNSRKLIGSNQRDAFGWEISVRNTKSEPVKISVEDQVPVSQNSQIEVTVGDTGGAKYDKNTGKLTWDLNIQPNETKKVTFKYEVKYPKDMNLGL